MKEYIERESLRDEIRSLSMLITGLRYGKGVLNEYMKQYRESVLRIVDEQPTADVVRVVRCKDCIHRDPEDKKCDCSFRAKGGIFPMDDNDFCSYGERRKKYLNEQKTD